MLTSRSSVSFDWSPSLTYRRNSALNVCSLGLTPLLDISASVYGKRERNEVVEHHGFVTLNENLLVAVSQPFKLEFST